MNPVRNLISDSFTSILILSLFSCIVILIGLFPYSFPIKIFKTHSNISQACYVARQFHPHCLDHPMGGWIHDGEEREGEAGTDDSLILQR